MFEALMEIVEPQIQLREKALAEKVWKEGREEGRREGIKGTIDVLRGIGYGDTKIQELIIEKYNLSKEEIVEYF